MPSSGPGADPIAKRLKAFLCPREFTMDEIRRHGWFDFYHDKVKKLSPSEAAVASEALLEMTLDDDGNWEPTFGFPFLKCVLAFLNDAKPTKRPTNGELIALNGHLTTCPVDKPRVRQWFLDVYG